MARNRCHIYSLYWAASGSRAIPACEPFSPDFNPTGTTDNNTGYLNISNLWYDSNGDGTADIIPTNYVIDWHLESPTGPIIITTGDSLATDPDISAIHPLIAEPVISGTYYPVIRFMTIDGVKYSVTNIPGASYSPDLLECLPSFIVQGYSCSCSNNYDTVIVYRNTSQSSADASREIDFSIDETTTFIIINLRGYNVYDDLIITYKRADNTEVEQLEWLRIGGYLNNYDLTTTPKLIDTLNPFKHVLDIQHITYQLGDYITFKMIPNPSEPNTDWDLSFGCICDSNFFNCIDVIGPGYDEIDPCSVTTAWNAADCTVRAYFTLKNPINRLTSNLYNYLYSTNAASSNGVTVSEDLGQYGIAAEFEMDSGSASPDTSYGSGSCSQAAGTITFEKFATYGVFTFSDINDYNYWETTYNYNKAWALANRGANDTELLWYLWYQVPFLTGASCGDVWSTNYLGWRFDSIVVFDLGTKTLTVTPTAPYTINYADIDPCDNRYENLVSFNNSSTYMNGLYGKAEGTTYSSQIQVNLNPIAIRFVSSIPRQEIDVTSTRYWYLSKLGLDELCDPSEFTVPYSTVNNGGLYSFNYVNVRMVSTDYSNPPVTGPDNLELYDHGVLIYKIVNGVRTIPALGTCLGD